MKRLQIFGLFFLLSIKIFGQIDMSDSTAQVIGYWNKNDKQTYIVTQQDFKIKDSDTTSGESYKYFVDISIVDSTADSYIINWLYRDYEILSDDTLLEKLLSISENLNITIRTNEIGEFQEVMNWEDIRDYILKGIEIVKNEIKDMPEFVNYINQMAGMFNTKESVESAAIKEMHQFYTFHGGRYEYGEEYIAEMKAANLYGGEPFDTKMTVWLDELNPDDNNFIVRMTQTIDSKQLTKAVYDYLVKMSETLNVAAPESKDMPLVTNEIRIASRIHGSGWIIYSVETREVNAEGQTNIEERIIEIQ